MSSNSLRPRRHALSAFVPAALASFAASAAQPTPPSAAERMQQSGLEEQQLKRRTGTYSRVEGRWQYVSMDTRFPVGIMPAYSFANESNGKLTLLFESLAFVGLGKEVEGRMIRSNLEIARESDDHEFVRQYWVQSDGSGRQWPAVEYEYTRRR